MTLLVIEKISLIFTALPVYKKKYYRQEKKGFRTFSQLTRFSAVQSLPLHTITLRAITLHAITCQSEVRHYSEMYGGRSQVKRGYLLHYKSKFVPHYGLLGTIVNTETGLHQSNVNRTSLFQPQRLKAGFNQEYPISRPLTKTIFTHCNRPFLVNKFCPALQTCSYILMGTIILAGKGKAVEFSFPNHGREEE